MKGIEGADHQRSLSGFGWEWGVVDKEGDCELERDVRETIADGGPCYIQAVG